MTTEKLAELTTALEELKRRQTENRLGYYEPYVKQAAFHALGASKRERVFLAGNQQGKTYAGACELAMHLTGLYADWWQGRRFTGPVRTWAAGVTSESVRDTVQRLLLGPLGAQGTGAIPKDRILEVRNARGIADAVDTVLVRHASGGASQVTFKSYERGREKLQGETLDCIWLDEEPPPDIYSEALARITARNGIVYLTCTPLLGMTEVVRRFLSEKSDDRAHIQMGLDEALHIPAADREKIIAGYAPHEREARVQGTPMLGSGRVFPVAESMIAEDAFNIPKYWPRLCAIDFGWDHPTAAVWIAWDRDADVVHITDLYKARQEAAPMHAAAIRARGSWIPVAWPQDGLQHDKGAGQSLAGQYKKLGLNMLPSPARWDDGGNSVEAGISEMLTRMQTGRMLVARHLNDWFEEFRVYHRDNGRLVKQYDDALSATRYAIMSLKHARVQPDHAHARSSVADGAGADVLGLYGMPTEERSGGSGGAGVRWGNPPYDRLVRQQRRIGTARGVDEE